MIKFAHIADIHIGMDNYGRVNPATGLSTRLEDFLATLDEVVDRAIDERVDLFVVAGDIYKTRDPTPTHQREFARRVHRLTQSGAQVFLVAGNHDLPLSPSRATAMDIFTALEIPGVTVGRHMQSFRIETRSGLVQILALPWLTRSQVLAVEDYKGLTIEELNEKMVSSATEHLWELARELDPDIPTMLVAHAHVFGAKTGAEKMLNVGHDPMLNLQALSVPNVGYTALGHIHRHQAVISVDPAIVYAGSINRVDFAEEEEEKGFVLGELHSGRCDWEFVPIHARPFVTIRATLDEDDPTESVLREIRKTGERLNDAVVRLDVNTSRAAALLLKEDAIRAELRSAFLVAPMRRHFTDDEVHTHAQVASGLQPLEALELYLRQSGRFEADRQRTLLEHARRLTYRQEP